MFWHLHISPIVWIRVCFLCREKESRARTSGPGDRITLNIFFFIFFPIPWHVSAPQICDFFLWIMISSLLWLTSARQASNTQVVGEMGSTPAHTSSWWGFSERERGKDCCYNENELNEHFASFFSLFSSFLLFSYLFFSSFFFPLFSSPFQSQRFITTPGWTRKLLPWFSTYQELIFKKRSEKKERKCKKEDLGQTFSHNVPHCTYLGRAWSTDRKSNN